LIGDLRWPGFDANLWWIDLRVFPRGVGNVFLLVSGVSLVGYAVRPPVSVWRRVVTIGSAGGLLVVAGGNVFEFYNLLRRGVVAAGVPIPLTIFVVAALGLIIAVNLRLASAEALAQPPEDF